MTVHLEQRRPRSKKHAFLVSAACEVGVEPAIVLGYISFRARMNERNGNHVHDGIPWACGDPVTMQEVYPYLSVDRIARILDVLEETGYIVSGVYNDDGRIWYALTDLGEDTMAEEAY